ncbi:MULTISPECIES: glycosyltransferase [unclassified Adlercreutzia]|uniref:glycosyltransferase n=1 Tax=unclassified Adlercreutzia TaxID=2636013 RepID=UPI0013EA2987|nr:MULTISPECIES: glycosyltransferase [unclassified Adlercreutzia]
MRSLFVINSLSGGGAERVVLNMVERMARESEVDVATVYAGVEVDYRLPSSVTVADMGVDPGAGKAARLAQLLGARRRLDAFVRERELEGGYDLITAHLTASHMLARASCVRHRCLYAHHASVGTIEEGAGALSRVAFRAMYRDEGVVAVSQGTKGDLVRAYGLSDGDVRVVLNPVPVDEIRARSREPISFERPFVLFVGRLVEVKRPGLMLEAYEASSLRETHDLVFLGKGPLEGELRELARSRGLGGRVYLMGFQANPYAWMARSSAMVMTSSSEAFPMVLVEGLVSGARVVAGDCDWGPREILTGDLARFLVPKDDVSAYARAMEGALEGYPALPGGFAERYGVDGAVRGYLDFYRERMDRGREVSYGL